MTSPTVRLAGLAVAASVAMTGTGPLHAAPLYSLQYAFTNTGALGNGGYAFGTRAVAGMNDSGDVCGTFVTSNNLDNTVGFTDSVYLMRNTGVVYDLFPRGVAPAVQSASANNLTQRHPDGSLQIVGSVTQADGFQRGAIWNVALDGTFSINILTNLVLPPDSLAPGEQPTGEANAINASGFVVGDGLSYHAGVGLNWAPPYLSAPSKWAWGNGTTALAVNDDGTVLVNADFGNGYYNYPDNYGGAGLIDGANVIKLPPASVSYPQNTAFAMSGATVTGSAYMDNGDGSYGSFPFFWNRGDSAITQLPVPNGLAYDASASNGEGDSINTNGNVVGYFYNTNYFSTPDGTSYGRGYYYGLWKKQGANLYAGYDVDGLLPMQPGFSLVRGNGLYPPQSYDIAINDQDDIAVHLYGVNYNNGKRYEAIQVYRTIANGVVQFENQGSFYGDRSSGFVTATVDLIRADAYMDPVTVHFATSDGDAVAGQDYATTNGDLVWGFGETGSKTITVQMVTTNYTYNPNENAFHISLSNPSGAQIGNNDATVNLYSDDGEETVLFANTLGLYEPYYVQAGASNVVVTLSRSAPFHGTMVITNITTSDGNAYAGIDYQAISSTTPITWNPGQPGAASISIPLLGSAGQYSSPVSFDVEVQGAIDGTNSVDSWGSVQIMPVDQTPAFQFETSAPLRNGNSLSLTSYVEQGLTVELQSSTNLVDWTTVSQTPCTNGMVQFSPSISPGQSGRFYRAVTHLAQQVR